jgi:hypothetical protein
LKRKRGKQWKTISYLTLAEKDSPMSESVTLGQNKRRVRCKFADDICSEEENLSFQEFNVGTARCGGVVVIRRGRRRRRRRGGGERSNESGSRGG